MARIATTEEHRSAAELAEGLAEVRAAPRDAGPLEMIVGRPAVEARAVFDEAHLDVDDGLPADRWADQVAADDPARDAQLTMMSSRVLALVAGPRERWPLAGDQLVADLDLSEENLPVGSRLAVGGAELEVTPKPHRGCSKFVARFGVEAQRLTASDAGRSLRLRGVYVRVVRSGTVTVGDEVRVVTRAPVAA